MDVWCPHDRIVTDCFGEHRCFDCQPLTSDERIAGLQARVEELETKLSALEERITALDKGQVI